MKSYNNLYEEIISLKNLILAWKKARKGKTKREYVKEFEENLAYNLKILYNELNSQTYNPQPLKIFILHDPKTRKISKSAFRDRIVHHALCNIIEPFFDRTFIYDSCANRKEKGTLLALKRFEIFRRKVTSNFTSKGFCLKADIKHYFNEIDYAILLEILKRRIKCRKTIWLIEKIIQNKVRIKRGVSVLFPICKGIPLGNLTSQFFANVYLNELDQFVKYKLKIRFYIRYVDDFVILHKSKTQLEEWKLEIENFLKEKLKLELHQDKSKIINLSKGVDFVGFRNFYRYKLLRKRNIKNMEMKIRGYKKGESTLNKLLESFEGWIAYSKWSNSYSLGNKLVEMIFYD